MHFTMLVELFSLHILVFMIEVQSAVFRPDLYAFEKRVLKNTGRHTASHPIRLSGTCEKNSRRTFAISRVHSHFIPDGNRLRAGNYVYPCHGPGSDP